MKESEVATHLKKELKTHKIFYERINTTGIPTEFGLRKDLNALGRPDFFIVYKGRLWVAETKSSTGQLRIAQELWVKRFKSSGAIYRMINSIESVDQLINQILSS